MGIKKILSGLAVTVMSAVMATRNPPWATHQAGLFHLFLFRITIKSADIQ